MIKVLIVDDSPCAAECISAILSADPDIQVAGVARNGTEAVRMTELLRPDLVCMDITMPEMDGLEATRRIMTTCPIPIVIVSSLCDREGANLSFRALEVGAVAVLSKPGAITAAEFPTQKQELLRTVKAMAEVRVVRRTAPKPSPAVPAPPVVLPETAAEEGKLVAIGASTGGPQVIQEILAAIPALSAPIVIVQHITAGFEESFTAWLQQTTQLPVTIAAHHELLQPGHVYVAPAKTHLEVTREGRISLVPGSVEHGVCPSVSRFFRSVAAAFGHRAIGVILSGMGRDGAEELKLMRQAGAVTIAQDRESSVVHGMPGEAIRLDAAALVLPVQGIARMLRSLVGSPSPPDGAPSAGITFR